MVIVCRLISSHGGEHREVPPDVRHVAETAVDVQEMSVVKHAPARERSRSEANEGG
jgi:hypothetical protein